jgi:hypothetical protein
MTANDPIELRVARVLRLIAEKPNARSAPTPGDVEGEFDVWFDGGAVRVHTGYEVFRFADGTKAIQSALPWLEVGIRFADGRQISIAEDKERRF